MDMAFKSRYDLYNVKFKIYIHMEVLLRTIFTQHFLSSRCLVLVTDEYNTFNPPAGVPFVNINLKLNNFSSKCDVLFNYFGCQDFIVNVNKPITVFQNIETEIKLHNDRFNTRKYVLIQGADEQESLFGIFNTKEIRYVSDVLVIYKEYDSERKKKELKEFFKYSDCSYSFWTHKFVGLSDNNKPYMLDKWFLRNASFLFDRNLFPDKLTDQEGRSLRAAVFQYAPYVVVEVQEDQTYKYLGSEMLTMLTFAQHYNMTLVPIINELDYWGEVWDNFSGNGLMGNIAEDNADIGGAALYTWGKLYKFLDLSKPTVRTGITCLVPAPKLAAGWLTPLYAYAKLTWLAVVATYGASASSLYLLELMHHLNNKRHGKVKMLEKSLWPVFKALVSQNVCYKEVIKGQLGRYLMGLVFMTSLIHICTYESGLATVMTVPQYENPINTVDEFVSSGIFWGATQEAWITSIQQAKEDKFKIIVSRFVATSEEKLRRFSLTGKFAFSVERLPWGNYAVGPYLMKDVIQNFHLMYEDLYWEQCVLMTRKNSILLPYVDMFILRIFEANLISYWQNQAATQYMDQYVQKAVRYYFHHQRERVTKKLNIFHVAGAFGILSVGSGLALISFLTEFIYYRIFERKIIIPFII